MRSPAARSASLVLLALAVSACAAGAGPTSTEVPVTVAPTIASAPEPAELLQSALGSSMSAVVGRLGEGVVVRTIDASAEFGAESSFSPEDLDSPLWRVIGLCADAEELSGATVVEVLVVPDRVFAVLDQSAVLAAAYRDWLACDGLSHTA